MTVSADTRAGAATACRAALEGRCPRRAWLDGVAEADVHGDWNARTGQCGSRAQPRPTVPELFSDGLDPKAVQIEAHTVVDLDRHHLAERLEQGIVRRVAEAQEVHVAR
jgi:hypothetical protein